MRQRLGQHFLYRTAILQRIAAAACPQREPLVIEIGPGKGSLTDRLLARVERLIVIELDGALAARLREKYAGERRVTILTADALETDLGQWGPAVITGNLPYYAATPIVSRSLEPASHMKRGVFLLQKEVADRLAASPGSRDYGYLTVATRLFAGVRELFAVSPSAFRPPPKVDSALVCLDPHRPEVDSPARFLEFLSRCFRQKRKTLRNNLASAYSKEILDALPEARLRAEQLSLEQFADLYRRLVG